MRRLVVMTVTNEPQDEPTIDQLAAPRSCSAVRCALSPLS